MADGSATGASTLRPQMQVWLIEGPAFEVYVPRHGILRHLGRQTPWTVALTEQEKETLRYILTQNGLQCTVLQSPRPPILREPPYDACLTCFYFDPVLGCLTGSPELVSGCPEGKLSQ